MPAHSVRRCNFVNLLELPNRVYEVQTAAPVIRWRKQIFGNHVKFWARAMGYNWRKIRRACDQVCMRADWYHMCCHGLAFPLRKALGCRIWLQLLSINSSCKSTYIHTASRKCISVHLKKKFTILLSYSSASDLDGPPKVIKRVAQFYLYSDCSLWRVLEWHPVRTLVSSQTSAFPFMKCYELWHCSVLGLCCHERVPGCHSCFDLRKESVCFGFFFKFYFMSCLSYSEFHWVIKNLRLWVKSCAKGENNLSRESLEPWSWT